jgi:hypothetical protein
MSGPNFSDCDREIAAKLRKLWMEHPCFIDLTQGSFAAKYDFSQSFISHILTKRTRLTHAVICAFAKELSVSPLELDPLFHEPSRFRR